MAEQTLSGLTGNTPVGLLAALGLLDVLARTRPDQDARLAWSAGIVPIAVVTLTSPLDIAGLVDLVLQDTNRWRHAQVLHPVVDGALQSDVKLAPEQVGVWAGGLLDAAAPADRADVDLHRALVAEGALANTGEAKPTHLHFLAGQQRFLEVARELAEGITAADLDNALRGPWTYGSGLKGFNWDARGARIYAVSGSNPASDKKLTAPGVNWLALLGLSFFPVVEVRRRAVTTGASAAWKKGTFTWPLWQAPVTATVARSLLARADLAELDVRRLQLLGVHRVYGAPVTRSDQGGYGSFGPSSVLASAG